MLSIEYWKSILPRFFETMVKVEVSKEAFSTVPAGNFIVSEAKNRFSTATIILAPQEEQLRYHYSFSINLVKADS